MTRSDPYDELAAMFMTEDDARVSPNDGSRAGTTLDVLLVGHLPVRAALWLTPFADSVARDAGTTALVRLDGDEPLIQVLRGQDHGPINASRNLRETVLDIGPRVDAWIVRPSLQTTVPELVRATCAAAEPGHVDASATRFTILSSADQAAVVNAYRLVKDLVETASRDEVATPEIGLAVIGTDEDTAHAVAERLSRTTLECMGVDVPLLRCLPRIDSAIRGSALRTFPGRARPRLDDVLGWIDEARTRRSGPGLGSTEVIVPKEPAPERSTPGRTSVADATPEFLRAPEVEPRGSEFETETEPQTVDSSSSAVDPPSPRSSVPPPTIEVPLRHPTTEAGPSRASGARSGFVPVPSETRDPIPGLRDAGSIRLDPKVPMFRPSGSGIEPKVAGLPREPDREGTPVPLAEHVDGLTALAPRCPGQERIELAVDGAGMLHLLCRDDALRGLHAVAAWTRTHRELLALACPSETLQPGGAVMQHVFTDVPLRVADLHASELRLHLLAPVQVDGRIGWYSAPLNAPMP